MRGRGHVLQGVISHDLIIHSYLSPSTRGLCMIRTVFTVLNSPFRCSHKNTSIYYPTEVCVSWISPTPKVFNNQFDQLTSRLEQSSFIFGPTGGDIFPLCYPSALIPSFSLFLFCIHFLNCYFYVFILL